MTPTSSPQLSTSLRKHFGPALRKVAVVSAAAGGALVVIGQRLWQWLEK